VVGDPHTQFNIVNRDDDLRDLPLDKRIHGSVFLVAIVSAGSGSGMEAIARAALRMRPGRPAKIRRGVLF
jgi:hypothetical protein